ncbi:hypothetical protein ACFSTC_09110 [Nonomuraea ferruginea]
MVPGDPAVAYAGPKATPEQLAEVRARFGLDDPLWVQLGNYVRDLVTGDWQTSLHTRRPVLEDLYHAFPASLELVGAKPGDRRRGRHPRRRAGRPVQGPLP